MCGIAGFLGLPASGSMLEAARAMSGAIAHRGPDADGHWVDETAGVALAHRRLSIIDLSTAGAQPMVSGSGRYVIVFNGEIYNFRALRDELAAGGSSFRGHSDTEVLLAAIERWGPLGAAPRIAGMFAFALWDREDHTLTLVRDRLGEKPLYYGRSTGAWLFGSEMTALRAWPGVDRTVSRGAVAELVAYGYIRAPRTILEQFRKVRPGTAVVLKHGADPQEQVYWDPRAVAHEGVRDPLTGDDDAMADALLAVLSPVVGDEMVSDVPLGAFLSGGIDSSLIVALMQERSARPIRTFTIGFDDPRFDETRFAAAVATHLGTDHTELTVSGEDALELVPNLAQYYDEPLADASQLPTLLVSRLTRRHVTVALSGDGGDELFGGYAHHHSTGLIGRIRGVIPPPFRRVVGDGLSLLEDTSAARLFAALSRLRGTPDHWPANTLGRLSAALHAEAEGTAFAAALALNASPGRYVTVLPERWRYEEDVSRPWSQLLDASENRMLIDATSYLADDILVKVDRAAMAFSLETRAPILDHRVFTLAWRMPLERKLRDGRGKLPLRTLLSRYVPRELFERPKQGFRVPLGAWLRGPLRPWAEAQLDEDRLRRQALLVPAAARRLWAGHLRGDADLSAQLWPLLVLTDFVDAMACGVSHAPTIAS